MHKNKEKTILSVHNYIWKAVYEEKRKNPPLSCDDTDLYQAGMLGATHAYNKYNKSTGVPYISYAKHWIHRYIKREIYKYLHTTSVPRERYIQNQYNINTKEIKAHHHAAHTDPEYDDTHLALSQVDDRLPQIVDLLHQGYTQQEIAESIGTNQMRISRLLKKARQAHDSKTVNHHH